MLQKNSSVADEPISQYKYTGPRVSKVARVLANIRAIAQCSAFGVNGHAQGQIGLARDILVSLDIDFKVPDYEIAHGEYYRGKPLPCDGTV